MDAAIAVPEPVNEPIRTYTPGSPERATLHGVLADLATNPRQLPQTIAGVRVWGDGDPVDVVQPHARHAVLGTLRQATAADVAAAVEAALAAGPAWRSLPFSERAAVMLRAADLIAGPWRDTLNAATMLGQSKTVVQAEIDAACELIDFLRFNVHFAERILADQPRSGPGSWNRFDHRPLEGFVLAITPFNFTAIAGNLPTAPALMGNTVVWKPSPTQQLSAHHFLRVMELAGLPPGVINLVTGDGAAVSEVALTHPALAGVHFTGSTRTFQHLWQTVGSNLGRYAGYPRLVGETGGKDFVIAHPSADPDALHTALIRGAFEYQGQKCSAASRAYLPRSLWLGGLRDRLVATASELRYGDVTDFGNFGGAVIDQRAYQRLVAVLERLAGDPACRILAGGTADDTEGWFVRPTVVECTDPGHELFTTEYFGPILGVYVYPDGDPPIAGRAGAGAVSAGPMLAFDARADAAFDAVVDQAADVAPYALTGAVFATDRAAIQRATERLRFSAGNLYINDKPTGAVVGQQPFGGARSSGTNDKAGSPLNLLRWVSPRTIKETFVPPTDHRYPHMAPERSVEIHPAADPPPSVAT